jgi:hypothetical protein
MRKIYFVVFVFFISLADCFPQWNSNTAVNTPVCLAPSVQMDLRMCDDGHKGVFITWKDYRNGAPDIYAQHLDSNGIPKWTTNGVPVCTNSADQSTPAIVSDMNGGVIIAWSDWRSSIERDLYAQRLNANGIPLWTLDGVVVTNLPQREHNERLVTDEMGGAIIVFEKQNTTNYRWEVWAQRINGNGTTLWVNGGIRLSGTPAEFLNPRIQKDGKGGAIVTWQDFSNGINYDVYAQRITGGGILKWGSNGKKLCSANGGQTNPKIDPDSVSGGAIIAWTDIRNGIDYDIYAQKLDSAGNLLWGVNGQAICTATGNQSAVDLLSNSRVNGTIITWKDQRNGLQYDIYAQKINGNGVPQWTSNGIVVCNAISDQVNPNITGDNAGGAVIVWQDLRSGNYDIMAQRINNSGSVLWANNGVSVGIATGNQTSPKNVSDEAGGSIFAWEDSRAGTQDIYAHKIFYDGFNVGFPEENFVNSIAIAPNPVDKIIRLTYIMLNEDKINLCIHDMLGNINIEIPIDATFGMPGNHEIQLDLSAYSLPPGIYFLLFKGSGFTNTFKILKN